LHARFHGFLFADGVSEQDFQDMSRIFKIFKIVRIKKEAVLDDVTPNLANRVNPVNPASCSSCKSCSCLSFLPTLRVPRVRCLDCALFDFAPVRRRRSCYFYRARLEHINLSAVQSIAYLSKKVKEEETGWSRQVSLILEISRINKIKQD